MYISPETIITAASVLTALSILTGFIFSGYRWYLKQDKKNKEIVDIKEEMKLICYCMSAGLDGLMQLGANHCVPVAKEKLDDYINKRAHEQEE